MVKTWFTYNLEQEEGVGAETCRNSDMAWKLRATGSKEAGFKEKLIQGEGLHIFHLEVLISEKSHGQLTGCTHTWKCCCPHAGPTSKVRKGQLLTSERQGRDIRAWQFSLRQTSYFQSIRSSLFSSLPESWGTRSERRGSQTPGAPHMSDRQRLRRANLSSSRSSI